jgi:hypothetical protein
MATTIHIIWLNSGIPDAAIRAEVKANGRANIEWENLIIRKYTDIFIYCRVHHSLPFFSFGQAHTTGNFNKTVQIYYYTCPKS